MDIYVQNIDTNVPFQLGSAGPALFALMLHLLVRKSFSV